MLNLLKYNSMIETKPTVTSFELRFGNFIKYYDEIVQVYGTKGLYVFVPVPVIGEDKEYTLEEVAFSALEPIPLTTELLEKCGFEAISSTSFRIVTSDLDFIVPLSFTGNGYNTSIATTRNPLIYLHQIQNLYFALTGKELYVELLNNEQNVQGSDTTDAT
jgi:hypothetical protein